jgi:hypothetical protein
MSKQMPDHMSDQMLEKDAELALFIEGGSHCLATISSNDYGFQLSAMMAQAYLAKAVAALQSQHSRDQTAAAEVGKLMATAAVLGDEYAQLERFCDDCQRFNRLRTNSPIEWVSKWVVRAKSRNYLVAGSHHLGCKIRTFHATACSVLLGKERR